MFRTEEILRFRKEETFLSRTEEILLSRTEEILLSRTEEILLSRTNEILLSRTEEILVSRTDEILLFRTEEPRIIFLIASITGFYSGSHMKFNLTTKGNWEVSGAMRAANARQQHEIDAKKMVPKKAQ